MTYFPVYLSCNAGDNILLDWALNQDFIVISHGFHCIFSFFCVETTLISQLTYHIPHHTGARQDPLRSLLNSANASHATRIGTQMAQIKPLPIQHCELKNMFSKSFLTNYLHRLTAPLYQLLYLCPKLSTVQPHSDDYSNPLNQPPP